VKVNRGARNTPHATTNGVGVSRRQLLKAGGLMAAGTAAAPILAACGEGQNKTAAAGSASYTMWASSDSVKPLLYFYNKYKKVNKNFSLKITEVPVGLSYRAKILSASGAGQLPDILDVGYNYASDFATYGMFQPLNDFFDEGSGSEYSLYEEVWNWNDTKSIPGYDGDRHIFGLPWGMSVFVPAYRVDLFKQAGVEFPTSWDELVTAGQALTQPPKRYGLSIPTSGDLIDEFHPFLMQSGTSYVNEDISKAFPEREAAYQAFEFYRDLATRYKIAPKTAPDRFSQDPVQRLASGQVAMTTLPTYVIDAFKTTVKDLRFGPDADWFVGKFWEGPGGPGGYFNASALTLRRGVRNPKAAVDFFKWMVQPEQQIDLYRKFSRPPVNTSVWKEFGDDVAWPIYEQALKDSKRQGGFRGWKLAEFAVDRGVERVIKGGEDIQLAVDQTADDMIQALRNA
jgi:multiple sugar transport system substrate-binding protein